MEAIYLACPRGLLSFRGIFAPPFHSCPARCVRICFPSPSPAPCSGLHCRICSPGTARFVLLRWRICYGRKLFLSHTGECPFWTIIYYPTSSKHISILFWVGSWILIAKMLVSSWNSISTPSTPITPSEWRPVPPNTHPPSFRLTRQQFLQPENPSTMSWWFSWPAVATRTSLHIYPWTKMVWKRTLYMKGSEGFKYYFNLLCICNSFFLYI